MSQLDETTNDDEFRETKEKEWELIENAIERLKEKSEAEEREVVHRHGEEPHLVESRMSLGRSIHVSSNASGRSGIFSMFFAKYTLIVNLAVGIVAAAVWIVLV